MSDHTLRPITNHSWILQRDGNRLALITERDGALHAIGKIGKQTFKDLDDLGRHLGTKITVESPPEDEGEEIGNIDGYPVKHSAVLSCEHASGLPVYKRGKVEHAAGYYGVKFTHGWVASYCPKLSTLMDNERIGPFRTKLEMQNAISQKKRAIDV